MKLNENGTTIQMQQLEVELGKATFDGAISESVSAEVVQSVQQGLLDTHNAIFDGKDRKRAELLPIEMVLPHYFVEYVGDYAVQKTFANDSSFLNYEAESIFPGTKQLRSKSKKC